MSPPANEFRKYLSDDEPIVDVGTGRLVERSVEREGAVGITDRRVLFLSGDTGFTDFRYDQICSIWSWPRERLTARGLRVRLAAVSGVLLAALALLVQVVLMPTAFGSLLALVAVGGFVAAEAVRRTGVDIDWAALYGIVRNTDRTSDDGVIRQRWETKYIYAHQLLLVGAGLLGAVSAVSLAVLAGSPIAFALTLVALGGLAVADYAVRRVRRLDRLGKSWRNERDVIIRLAGGHDVTVRLDSDERIDRVLSRSSTTDARDRRQRHDRDPSGTGLSGL